MPMEKNLELIDAASVAQKLFTASATGSQLAVHVYTLARHIDDTDHPVKNIGDDILSTSTELQLLGKSLTQNLADDDKLVLNQLALSALHGSAVICEMVFEEIDRATKSTLEQSAAPTGKPNARSTASRGDEPKLEGTRYLNRKADWPLLRPHSDRLMEQMSEARATMRLISKVETLALSQKTDATEITASSLMSMQREIYRLSVAMDKLAHDRDCRTKDPLGHSENGRSDNDTIAQSRLRSLETASPSEEEEMTLTPLGGSYTMLRENSSSDPTVSVGHDSASGHPSQLRHSPPGKQESQCSQQTQHASDDDLPPEENVKMSSGDVLDKDKSKKGTRIHLFHLQPIVRDDADLINLVWAVSEIFVSQSLIQDHMDKNREEGAPSVVEAYQKLSRHEREAVRVKLDLYFCPNLVWLKRTYTDVTHRDILFQHIPVLQFVLMHETTGEPMGPLPLPISSAINSTKELELVRPTYIRSHVKHLSPDTLDAYDLPWQWDQGDSDYLIIRTWLNESDQDILFEHTRNLRNSRKGKPSFTDGARTPEEGGKSSHLPREERKNVITVKDAICRTLIFPFDMCNTWAGISGLITDTFRTVKSFDPWVASGHYDLFTANDETILPKVWHAIVEPGAAITMRMRPRPEDFPKIETAWKTPVSETVHLSTISEEHSELRDETLDADMGPGEPIGDSSPLDTVDGTEVKRVVEELLERYTLPLSK
ncbi:MAG: hypothetical protein Q9226_005740 [Calogaya cf. arnoldii]